jgi:hypothetical protein
MSFASVNITVVLNTWTKFIEGRDAFIAKHRAELLEKHTKPRKFLWFTRRALTQEEAIKMLTKPAGLFDGVWYYRGKFDYNTECRLKSLYDLAVLAGSNGVPGRKHINLSASDAQLIRRFNSQV